MMVELASRFSKWLSNPERQKAIIEGFRQAVEGLITIGGLLIDVVLKPLAAVLGFVSEHATIAKGIMLLLAAAFLAVKAASAYESLAGGVKWLMDIAGWGRKAAAAVGGSGATTAVAGALKTAAGAATQLGTKVGLAARVLGAAATWAGPLAAIAAYGAALMGAWELGKFIGKKLAKRKFTDGDYSGSEITGMAEDARRLKKAKAAGFETVEQYDESLMESPEFKKKFAKNKARDNKTAAWKASALKVDQVTARKGISVPKGYSGGKPSDGKSVVNNVKTVVNISGQGLNEQQVSQLVVDQISTELSDANASTDNNRPLPIKVTIEGVVSDTPIDPIKASREADRLFGGSGVPSTDALAHLIGIRDARLPIRIATSLRVYNDMALTSLVIPRDSTASGGLMFTATFQQITFVENSRVTIKVKGPRKKKKEVIQKPVVDNDIVEIFDESG